MCAAGMTQMALAEREGFSEAKASMYVRAGNAITPQRIADAGLVPGDLAEIGIVKLGCIGAGPQDQLAARILAAVNASRRDDERAPAFEWKKGRKVEARATFRTTDLQSWSREERVEFIGTVGPLLAEARRLEGIEDPSVGEARLRLEKAHRIALNEAREDRTEQVLRLMELNAKLLLALNDRREAQAEFAGAQAKGRRRLQRLRLPLQRALRWVGLASTVEGESSTIEDRSRERDAQIRIRFDGERAA